MFVHGDSLKSCVVAVIVPHQAEITEWAVRRGVQADSFTGLCASRQVRPILSTETKQITRPWINKVKPKVWIKSSL